jgi:tetratricopeptide (TPR) repeat protein
MKDNQGEHYENRVDFWFYSVVASLESRKFRKAIEVYKQAIRERPDDADTHYNLGFAYLNLNDRNAALQEHSILKNLDPQMADRLLNAIHK